MQCESVEYHGKQMDTYKVATTANSESTMHTLMKKPLEMSNFSFDGFDETKDVFMTGYRAATICELNRRITYYNEIIKSDPILAKEIWRTIIQDLPSAFNQKRTWTGSYETLLNIVNARGSHKLIEWHKFCQVMIDDAKYFGALHRATLRKSDIDVKQNIMGFLSNY